MKILFVCFISECLLSFSRCVGLDPSKTLHITIHQQMLQDYSRNINLVLAPACSHWGPQHKENQWNNCKLGNSSSILHVSNFLSNTCLILLLSQCLFSTSIMTQYNTGTELDSGWTNYSPTCLASCQSIDTRLCLCVCLHLLMNVSL